MDRPPLRLAVKARREVEARTDSEGHRRSSEDSVTMVWGCLYRFEIVLLTIIGNVEENNVNRKRGFERDSVKL